jgi:hypothetical protein
MTGIHRRYEVRPRWVGDQWELHISGVGMITSAELAHAPAMARAYIDADLGHHALDDAEIVLLDVWPPGERAESQLQAN